MQNSDTCERKRNSFISHKEMRLGACEHTHTHTQTHTHTNRANEFKNKCPFTGIKYAYVNGNI